MRCPACEHENPEAARYCAACGAHLTASCPHCGAGVSPGTRFCTSCGGQIPAPGGTGVEGERESPGSAERRRVSVLFVDLENFTALAESLDPEEVRTIQSRYFEVARSIVARYGGTIEKFIGDAVMAVWGAPVAHEDDAERAVRAALALVDAVGRLGGAAAGTPLSARAAVTSGEAAVTVGATGQGMVAGDLVNTAARLQSEAPLGGMLVDQATRERAADAARFEPVGPLALKGRTAPLAAFRASSEAAPPPGSRHGAHTGPFVGRDRELRELIELFNGVAREGHSRLVSVTGIAGIGKSRLAWELQEHLDAIPEPVAWHSGRAPAYGDDVTFAAVAEMVRRRLRIDDVTEPQLAMRQLAGALRELVRDPDERRWLEPRVAVLLGREAAAAYDREELFAAWRRFFERVSDRAPTVLVFEDVQWADPSLLDFIEHLATWARDHPILIVTLARPELMDRRPSWGVTLRSFTALHLERLSDARMRELLLARAPSLPDSLVRRILEHAGGVPLYAVEVVRILADQAADGPTRDRRRAPRLPAPEPSAIDVPDSLHGLIAARIDALPRPERRLLLAAGVLGRRFRPGALIAVAGGDPSLTRERMESLTRRELLTVDDELGSPGQGEVGFVQDLVREVAYHTLARSERRDLHLDAARYLGSFDDDNLAESLAGHLVEAHRLAPEHPDATRIARRAVAALRLAARDAIRLHAPERAVGHLERALRLSATPAERAGLLEESSDAARAAGRLDVAEGHLRELVALHADSGHTEGAARARAQLASVLLIGQQNEPALVELETALRAIRDFGSDASGVELASQLARARMVLGDDRSGLEWAERALADAQRLGLDDTATDLLVTRGTARFRLGEEAAGLADLRRAIELSEAAGSLNTELRARNNVAWLIVADDPRATMETARQGFELASAMGMRDMAVQLADVACAAAIDTGDWDWALETVADLEERGISAAFQVDLTSICAEINALRGVAQPLAVMDAIDLDLSTIDPQVLAGVTQSRAWVAFVSGAFDDARTLATQAANQSFGAERARQTQLAVRASLWAGDADGARAGLRALDEVGVTGRATDAARETLAAGVAALDADPGAQARYRAAAESWRELALPLQLVLCLLDAQRLGGGTPAHPAESDRILRALGADGLASMASGGPAPAVSRRSAPPPRARSPRPTARTASRSDGGRRRRRATDPPAPSG